MSDARLSSYSPSIRVSYRLTTSFTHFRQEKQNNQTAWGRNATKRIASSKEETPRKRHKVLSRLLKFHNSLPRGNMSTLYKIKTAAKLTRARRHFLGESILPHASCSLARATSASRRVLPRCYLSILASPFPSRNVEEHAAGAAPPGAFPSQTDGGVAAMVAPSPSRP